MKPSSPERTIWTKKRRYLGEQTQRDFISDGEGGGTSSLCPLFSSRNKQDEISRASGKAEGLTQVISEE